MKEKEQDKPQDKKPVEAPRKKKPTAAQLAQLRAGGDYRFNPTTGQMQQTRQATQVVDPQATPATGGKA